MTQHSIQDESQRQRALDPRQSFIVQAPAGSGKTELLTQRFLVLLGHVNAPEEVLAITFTKKAAAEMRARIIKTLKKAASEPEPTAAHEKNTWQLAKRALQQDRELEWNLLENPNRLRIQTIDSFSASLIKHLPILSHFGAPPEIIDNPGPLYREAVQEFLSHLEKDEAWSDAIAQLLIHLDNDVRKVEELLINLLGKRDQWMRHMMVDAEDPELRDVLEANLAEVVSEILFSIERNFPAALADELLTLIRFAALNLRDANSERRNIINCLDLLHLPGAHPKYKNAWLGIKELLLTNEGEWRKSVDVRIGFPAKTNGKNAEEKAAYDSMKERHKNLLEKLRGDDNLLFALNALDYCPSANYQEGQWQTLHALYQALRIVVALLQLVFKQHGKIDYIENAMAAQQALGSDETPTDLALALDYQIKHILIDEFQDTSNSQFRLIQKLIAEWQPADGRTLFIVGDPMQSIYRFREADVAIFIRARREGICNVKLEPLTLSVNFRSTPKIVDWVNQHFQLVLPANEDIASGAVAYSHSIANQSNDDETSHVRLHPVADERKSAQAEAIVQLIQETRRRKPNESIAILVRARTHLQEIIPALKRAQLVYRSIKIDPLNLRSIIQDLMALTRALINPADRTAWLAILRAPWCGLSLADLHLLATTPRQAIWDAAQDSKTFSSLSSDGQQRLGRALPILKIKMAERQRFSLRAWVESTWLLLGGPACLEQDTDLEDVNAYFNLLEKLDDGGDLADLDMLAENVSQLFAAPNNQADNTLQIMTIHNAKGLEFDTVILPHLEKQSPHEKKQLLLWMERAREHHDSALILGPVHATGDESDSIYDYIKQQHASKTDHEAGRLLYVAATRAKKQLHLFLSLKVDEEEENDFDFKNPSSKSLLQKLMPSIQHEISLQHNPAVTELTVAAESARSIKRLTNAWQNPVREIPSDIITRHQKAPGFHLSQDDPRRFGTLVHKILENIARLGASWWQEKSPEKSSHFIKTSLLQAGVLSAEIDKASAFISTCINNTLQDSRGQWILQPHAEAQTEIPLSAVIDGAVKHLVIDRSFIDNDGTRWIIDYKTAHYDGENLEVFLTREQAEYAEQMSHYFKAMRFIDERPIKLGLYFPAIPAWHEWEI